MPASNSRTLRWAALVPLLTACAGHQDIRFTSEPPGATVLVEGQRGVTPVTLSLPVRLEYDVTFVKDGYEPTAFPASLSKLHCRPAGFWLLLFEPLAIVDCFTQGDGEDDLVHVTLIPKPSS